MLMVLMGTFFALFNSSTYGCGMEATSPKHATLMYGLLTLFTGFGSFAASYASGTLTQKHILRVPLYHKAINASDHVMQLLIALELTKVCWLELAFNHWTVI